MYYMRPILAALLKSILLLSSALSLYYTNSMTRALNNSQTNPVLVTTHNQCTNTHRHVINAAYSIDFIYNRLSHFFFSNPFKWRRKMGKWSETKKRRAAERGRLFLVEEQWGEWVICSQVYQSEGPVMGPSLRLRHKCLKSCWYLWGGRGWAVSFWCLQTPRLSSQCLLNL